MRYHFLHYHEDGSWAVGCAICRKVMYDNMVINDPRFFEDTDYLCPLCRAISQFADKCMDAHEERRKSGLGDLKAAPFTFRDSIREHLHHMRKGVDHKLDPFTGRDMKTLGIDMPSIRELESQNDKS